MNTQIQTFKRSLVLEILKGSGLDEDEMDEILSEVDDEE